MKVRSARPRGGAKSSSLWYHLGERFGLIGVCVYLIGFVLPLTWDIPLILLGICGALALIVEPKHTTRSWSPLTLPVLLFIASIGLSALFSEDIGRSARLSASLLPGLLLFFLLAHHVRGVRDLYMLSLGVSAAGIIVSSMVLWNVGRWNIIGGAGKSLHEIVPAIGIPILVVPNDATFLAIIAPFSMMLLCREPRSASGVIAATSLVLSILAICTLRSRTALLTLGTVLICTMVPIQPRSRLMLSMACILSILLIGVCADAFLFPVRGSTEKTLVEKIMHKSVLGGRLGYWSTAWEMFREAPLLGQGPHTFGLFHRTPWTHNLYLEVLAEQGIIGLAALVGLLASSIKTVWRVYRNATGEVRLFSASVLAALVGFCSAGVFELSLLRQWVVIVLFALLGIVARLSSSCVRTGG